MARAWKRFLSTRAIAPGKAVWAVQEAMRQMPAEILDARPFDDVEHYLSPREFSVTTND
jgi:hypothetical protein